MLHNAIFFTDDWNTQTAIRTSFYNIYYNKSLNYLRYRV